MEYLSKKQLETITTINKYRFAVDYGPFGCGKSYADNIALGLLCMNTKPMDNDSVIALIGRTSQSCKRNICNSLSSNFGENFKVTKNREDGYEKDALLFGHKCLILGATDKTSEERIRGMNCYAILCDEVSLWREDTFNLVMGRLRGPIPEGWGQGWMRCSTNPASPKNYLKKRMDKQIEENMKESDPGYIKFIKWSAEDNITSGSKLYYTNLKNLYKHNKALLQRYVYGEWAAADGLVYPEFDESIHVIPYQELEGAKYKEFYIGIDFGANHPMTAILIGIMPNNEHIVIDEISERNILIKDFIQKLVDMIGDKYISAIFVDPSAKSLRNELHYGGFGNLVRKAKNDVLDGIEYIHQLFNANKLYISSKCTNLIEQFYVYQWKDGSDCEVIKENDDLCDALRYACYTSSFPIENN